MKHCDKCNVEIRSNRKYCPLCHQSLSGETTDLPKEIYPEFMTMRREVQPFMKKLLMVASILSIVVLLTIDLIEADGRLFSLIPIGAILYFWLVVRYGILTKQNVAFRVAFLTTILIVVLNLFDQNFTDPIHRGWALNYVTPLLLLADNIAILGIILIKRINYRDYLFYLLTILVFSLIPLILAFFRVITIVWPSIATFSAAILILLVIVFFFPKHIKDEIRKRFHL
jgi:hypothetical protein